MNSFYQKARARVVGEERGSYFIQFSISGAGDELEIESHLAVVSGSFRHEALKRADYPAVGDWVLATSAENQAQAIIHEIFPRKSCLQRKAAGTGSEAQILAANVDTAFIVTSANMDLNLRRIERYLAVVWESGATPVVLLTKAELAENAELLLAEIEGVAIGVDVHAVSAQTGRGLEALTRYLDPGKTVTLVGSSGVGKSTLTNALMNAEVAAVKSIRDADGKGRHTTTSRHLFRLPGGAFLIDTPGMRELQLDSHEAGVQATYADVEVLLGTCKFTNCAHRSEPGCAVLRELKNGGLAKDRWEAYQKLEREIAFLSRKEDPAEMARERAKWKKLGAIGTENMKRKRFNLGS